MKIQQNIIINMLTNSTHIHNLATTLTYRRAACAQAECFSCASNMLPGFNHAAVLFPHGCPFKRTELWREPL